MVIWSQMTIENKMVNGTNGTQERPQSVGPRCCGAVVGTSRCDVRGRPGGPSLPQSVRCPRFSFSVRSSDMLKHGHHTLRLVELCIGCRRSLPWIAAVLCRFDFAASTIGLVSRFSDIPGLPKAVEGYRNPRRCRAFHLCVDAQQPVPARNVSLTRALGVKFTPNLTGCFTSFQLVSACFSLFHLRGKFCERSERGRPSGPSLPSCASIQHRILEAFHFRFTLFHLVSACFTYGKNFACGSSADGPAVRPYHRVPASSIGSRRRFTSVSPCFTWLHFDRDIPGYSGIMKKNLIACANDLRP